MESKLLLLPVLFLFLSFSIPKQKVWIALGDSITYLNDHPKETFYRVRKGYMTRVCESLPHITYVNHGYNGWTATRVAASINELGIGKADYYSIFLGTNDWWAGNASGELSDYVNQTGTQTVAGAFRVIINYLKEQNPDARLILITPMPRTDFVYLDNFKNQAYGSYQPKNGQELEKIVSVIRSIGFYEKIEVVNLFDRPELAIDRLVNFKYLKNPETGRYEEYGYPEYKDIPFDPEKDEYPYPPEAVNMTYDGLHPSDKGNELISSLLMEKLKIE